VSPKLTSLWKRTGTVEKLFFLLLVLYFVVTLALPSSILVPMVQLFLAFFAGWIVLRLARRLMQKALWRLRNRLLLTYLFIAVVPMLLTLTLVGASSLYFSRQLAVYMVTSELDRRAAMLNLLAQSVLDAPGKERPAMGASLGDNLLKRFDGSFIVAREGDDVRRWPESEPVGPPAEGWGNVTGIVFREGRFYEWAHVVKDKTDVTVAIRLSRPYLSNIIPGLGDVALLMLRDPAAPSNEEQTYEARTNYLVPPATWSDVDFYATSPPLQFSYWDTASKTATRGLISIHTRPSAFLGTIINTRIELQQFFLVMLFILTIVFAIIEIVSLLKGISLARTITGAVHELYEGTQRVMQGDFTHRIKAPPSRDQLAELGASFNSMTANVERLLAIAKEKERLQAEIAIAREVQEQLYPKTIPELPTLRLIAMCQPARMVSGDYYDFQVLGDGQLALGIGDVAGKGISAALLMATIQSATRTELRSAQEALAVNGHPAKCISTRQVVSDLNVQLHATTAVEKFATFCFGLYDERTSVFTYTNAGHLPPVLIRNGDAQRLDVNGMVVGAFPFAQYDESCVTLERGDLLVFFTDGITEPENEYGEMFGEDRLIDLIARNSSRGENEIVVAAFDAVRNWTNSPELQDDMTLLVARRL